MRLTKHHGLGNDFLVALSARNPGLEPNVEVSRRLCQRHHGVGADGLIWGLAGTPPGPRAPATDVTMVLHNSDGSVAEISGNGIRCLGQALLREEGRSDGRVVVGTAVGVREIEAWSTDDPLVDILRVEMGAVGPGPAVPDEVNRWSPLHAIGLSIGNPHLILEVDDLESVDLTVAGPVIEGAVPGGVNVHFLTVTGPESIRLLHWERGAGITEACGTGAAVAAAAANRWGLVDDRATVEMPGGAVVVELGDMVHLTGKATFVADVDVP